MKWYRAFSFLFTSVATGLAAAFLVLLLRPDIAGDTGPVAPPPLPSALSSNSGPVSYAGAVQHAAPSVVNIFAVKLTRQTPHPLLDDPLFQRLFGDETERPRLKRENNLGSGVIVDRHGHVLTNNHVIAGASEIRAVLSDGRDLPARIVGTDPETDLAILQVAGQNLPAATLGDSDRLLVGDVVMAIGNPFGVGKTVTLGIVSATGRDELGITDFENFIQTDAAINPGNSGGALINALGEVVGINTAIFSDSGGSHGVGFAIPIQVASEVLDQITRNGRVIRGWLGISGQNLTRALAESLELAYEPGILVSGVLQDGPGDVAGLQPGDIIVAVDDEPVTGAQAMLRKVAGHPPGTPISLTVVRGGGESTLIAVVDERPSISGQ